jgi:dipeptidase
MYKKQLCATYLKEDKWWKDDNGEYHVESGFRIELYKEYKMWRRRTFNYHNFVTGGE